MSYPGRPVRAAFVGGPLDGRVEPNHRPTPAGYVEAVDTDPPGRPLVDLNGNVAGDVTVRRISYRAHSLVDLDGTRLLVYALDDELRPGRPGRHPGEEPGPDRPDVTIWELLDERARIRRELEELRREAALADDRAALALRHADAMAGELRELRDDRTIREHRASGDT